MYGALQPYEAPKWAENLEYIPKNVVKVVKFMNLFISSN